MTRTPDANPPPCIEVWSKADLRPDDARRGEGLAVSAIDGRGLQALRRAIAQAVETSATTHGAAALAVAPRHDAGLRKAEQRLAELLDAVTPTDEPGPGLRRAELHAESLRSVLHGLSLVVGEVTPDDLLGRVFATFCVGK